MRLVQRELVQRESGIQDGRFRSSPIRVAPGNRVTVDTDPDTAERGGTPPGIRTLAELEHGTVT
jgi:hypothetical protein